MRLMRWIIRRGSGPVALRSWLSNHFGIESWATMREGRTKSTGLVTIVLDGMKGSGIVRRTVTSILTLSSLSMSLMEVICLAALSTIHPPKNAKHIIPRRLAVLIHQGNPAWAFHSSVDDVNTAPTRHIVPVTNAAVRKPACEGA